MICEGTHSLSQTLDASLQATFGAPAPSSTEQCRFFLFFPNLRVGLTKPWSANSGSWTAQRWCVSHFWIMFLRIIQHDLRIFCGTWLWVCTSTVWSEHSSVLCLCCFWLLCYHSGSIAWHKTKATDLKHLLSGSIQKRSITSTMKWPEYFLPSHSELKPWVDIHTDDTKVHFYVRMLPVSSRYTCHHEIYILGYTKDRGWTGPP